MERRKRLKVDSDKQRAWQRRGAEKYAEKQRAARENDTPRRVTVRPNGSRPARRAPARNDGPWRAEVMALHGEVCARCGDTAHVQADHLWPRGQGGPSHPLNGLPLCGEFSRNTPGGCHPRKTNGTIVIEFSWLLPEQVDWLAEVGWVAWDENGQPYGRGWKHFAPRRERGR